MQATWRVTLQGAIDEAILAVDLYNQPREPRRLEGFLVHMHIAWLYLLHAEFRRDGVDYRYRLENGHFDRTDGEPRTWELKSSVKERWPDVNAVRKNLELSIGLRNKIEHRFHAATTLATNGYSQALLLNFESELTEQFGEKYSLAQILRFPIFVGTITAPGRVQIDALRNKVPKDTRDFIANFESDLDPSIAQDQRYEFRINLVPKLGARTEADASITFVREDELSEDERKVLNDLGRQGQVIVREQTRPVASSDLYRPTVVAKMVQEKVPFKVGIHHVVMAWKKLNCRPPAGDANPTRTLEKYCVYNAPYRDYLYTLAFVQKLTRELATKPKFRAFTGTEPEPK
jgi:hypothetical protein